MAIGVGAPGPLDGKRGLIIEAPNLGWRNYPLADVLGKQTGIKTYLENDANSAGWGEFWAGAGRGCSNMVMMTLGTGVGGAIIIDGKLVRGPDGTAGEFGHVVIIDGGRPAATGNRGALEAYASATATVLRFKEALKLGWNSSLSEKADSVTCEDIFNAAHEGDGLASHIVTETGRYLGVMAANLANIFNPERCVISGGMIKAGDILFNSIKEECNRRAFPVPAARMEILPATLGADAGLIGAAGVALVRSEEDNAASS
jgi:glucokinase